jgi:hypothetical protein
MNTALDELAKAVAEWRTSKGRYDHMPKAWIQQARELAASIPETEICRRLGVRRGKLFPKAPEIPAPQFIELPPVAAEAAPANVRVELRRGAHVILVTLPGGVDLSALFAALRLAP